jgi:Zn-dependent protease
MGQAGIAINLWLMLLNLLPIPPLDGSRVVSQLLPRKMAYHYDHLERYGFFILIALLYLGALNSILSPMFQIAKSLIIAFLQLKELV